MPKLTVGPGGSPTYDHEFIQDAIDAITGTVLDRGTVVVAPGRYNERIDDDKSHVDVVAQVPGTVIVEFIEPVNTTSGGTYRIAPVADPEHPVVDKLLYGLRIIRNVSGAGDENPPEAALYVGQENGGDWPPDLYWDDIIIKNCIVEGVHDGIQCFGQGPVNGATAPETWPDVGLVHIQDCIIKCCHDALTMKGNMRMISKNNSIRVDSRGIAPYLTNIAPWKCTGFHMNTRTPTGNPNSFFHSSHDSIWVTAGDNIGEGSQSHVTGYMFYDTREGPAQAAHAIRRTEIVEPHVVVEYIGQSGENSGMAPSAVSGVAVFTTEMDLPLDQLIVAGGSFLVRQLSDEDSVPAYGVLVDDIPASPPETSRTVRALGARIKVFNAKSGQPCLSLAAIHDEDHIEADVYSDETTDDGDGSILAAAHQP